jgi:hypothetical protein
VNTTFDFVLFLLAVILFALVAFNVAAARINLLAAGLAAFALPFLIAAWPK